MYHITDRSSLQATAEGGRKRAPAIKPAVPENTKKMMAGFARFSYEYGTMDTHMHGFEYMYVIDAYNAIVKYGDDPDALTCVETLHPGDILRPAPGEWHRFDFLTDDGYVDFLNFFAELSDTKTTNAADLKKEEE